MKHRWSLLLLAGSLTFPGDSQPLKVAVQPLECIARDRNPRLTARIEGPVRRARVHFRSLESQCAQAAEYAAEYYVEMRPSPTDPTLYWAVLPLVSAETRTVWYQVRVDRDGQRGSSESVPSNVPVTARCIARAPSSAAEQRAARNITIGLTSSAQPEVPCGFRCDGIMSVLTAANELRPNEACFRVLAAAGKPWYDTRSGRVALIGTAVLGSAFIWKERRSDEPPASPARP